MLTLQKGFKYEGSIERALFNDVRVTFTIPVFTYTAPDDPSMAAVREQLGEFSLDLVHALADGTYKVELPRKELVGADAAAVTRFVRYTQQAIASPAFDVEDIEFEIQVTYGDVETGTPLGSQKLRALCLFRSTTNARRAEARGSLEGSGKPLFLDTGFLQPTSSALLISRTGYDALLKEFSDITTSRDENTFVFALMQLLPYLDEASHTIRYLNENARQLVIAAITENGTQNAKAALESLAKRFDRLFEFSLHLDEIKTMQVAGTFTLTSADASPITGDDLALYDLSADFTALSAAGEPEYRSLHLDWSANVNALQNGTIGFSLTAGHPVVANTIDGLISVVVKRFDGVVVWSRAFKPDNAELAELKIEAGLQRPGALTAMDGAKANKKLRGKVIALGNPVPLKGATVLVQARKDGDTLWRVVAAGTTDGSGNFTVPYPYGDYVAAQALVSLAPDSPVDIAIESTGNDQTLSDAFLYLLVRDAESPCADGQATGCQGAVQVPRLPDQSDLINSSDYSQDIGGSCINLSTPNRSLREFNYQAIVRTSDPDVANYTLRKINEGSYELSGGASKITRSPVDLDNPVKWQDAPDFHSNLSLYQSVTVATGHILHYKSEFKADGYSLGDLLYSLPLAPGQKKQIVIFDSSHSLRGAETQTLSQTENLDAALAEERTIADQLGGTIYEGLQGGSSADTSGVSAGMGASANFGFVGASLGVAGGSASSSSQASQQSSRNISQYFGEKLRQKIVQNADSYRRQNASVVTTVQEGQHYAAETEVVANHNHCHSLTMMYFEVLRHYAIYQELANVEECVFVPLLMTHFTQDNICKWRDVLARSLLPVHSNLYLQPSRLVQLGRVHPLLGAFDANDRIRTNYANVDFPATTYDDEVISFIKGDLWFRVNLPRPKTRYDRIKSLQLMTSSEIEAKAAAMAYAIAGDLYWLMIDEKTMEEQVKARERIFDAFMHLDANYRSVPPAKCMRVVNFHPIKLKIFGNEVTISGFDFFQDSIADKEAWTAYAEILGYTDVLDMLEYYFKGRLISEWDSIFYNDIAPLVYREVMDSLRIGGIATDWTTNGRYKGGERVMRVSMTGSTSLKRKQFPETISMVCTNSAIKKIANQVTFNLEKAKLTYATPHFHGTLYAGRVNGDVVDAAGVGLYAPESAAEKRNPRHEDAYLVEKLIEHLNSNLEHYNKALWSNLDPDRRYMLLDGFNIQTFDDLGQPAAFRSLASVVKNQLVSIVGNTMVFPVAAGYKIDKSYIVAQTAEGATEEISLFDHYRPLTPVPPYRISVPSRGVFMEAVKGHCNACEPVEENTSQDWTRFTTDEPTPLLPIATPTPTITDWKATFKDLASPIVNIQNAPATPAPGAGLAGLSDLLGKAGVFADVTGLEGNQANAMKTYLSNQENVRALAGAATSLTMQEQNIAKSDKIMNAIKSAKESGAISQEDYGKLTRDHLQRQIDGGESKRAELETAAASKPSVVDAAVKAVEQGATNVKASELPGGGKSIEISNASGKKILAQAGGVVPRIKQKDDTCWAAAATMMVSWKRGGKLLKTEEVLALADQMYVQLYAAGQPLPAKDKDALISALGMRSKEQANFLLQEYIDLVSSYGPLWITTDSMNNGGVFSPHARILIQVYGTGTPDGDGTYFKFIDPATGEEYDEPFKVFSGKYEDMVRNSDSGAIFLQIVHFTDKTQASTGEGMSVNAAAKGKPVHERATLTALIMAGALKAPQDVGGDVISNEYLRGCVWNDDPECLLFNDLGGNNFTYATGAAFLQHFEDAKYGAGTIDPRKNFTGRSHFGDMQFLHCMASSQGEDPYDTLAKVKLWAEFMYRVSTGAVPEATKLSDVAIVSTETNGAKTFSYTVADFFKSDTDPRGDQNVAYLLLRNTKFSAADVRKRALGSLMHLVQDSYTKGHVRRTLANPTDLLPGTTDRFTPGTWGHYGEIENFHCYVGQSSSEHAKYDFPLSGEVKVNDLSSFNSLVGGRDAIGQCVELIKCSKNGDAYELRPKQLIEAVFAVAKSATLADSKV